MKIIPMKTTFLCAVPFIVLAACSAPGASTAQPAASGAAAFPLPPMGYSSWNHGGGSFPCETNAIAVTDAIVRRGLKDAGYTYVMAFDGWWCTTGKGKRDPQGNIVPDPNRWPHGVKFVSDYIHGKGLKVAGYSDIGARGYKDQDGEQMGGYPHYQQDADQFADWGWDYIKIDDNNVNNPLPKEQAFRKFCDAIRKNGKGRPILLSLSTPCTPEAHNFGRSMANMWRTSQDLCIPGKANFSKTNRNACFNFDSAEDVWWSQAPGTWNDIDMMAVGMNGISGVQHQTLMNMWAIRGAPLIIGCNPVTAPQAIIDILTNREVIAVDQDPLCAQGRKVREDSPGVQVYSKPLGRYTGGDRAVLLLNRSPRPADIKVRWSDLGLLPGSVSVRDAVHHKDLGSHADGFTAERVAPDDSVLLKVTGGQFDWAKPRDYEAESVLNTLGGTAKFHAFSMEFSSSGMVNGIGGGVANTLQFNQVEAPDAGDYTMTLHYASAGDFHDVRREVRMSVNGGPPATLKLPGISGKPKVVSVQATISLVKGFNTIRFFHENATVPAIDKLSVQQSAQ